MADTYFVSQLNTSASGAVGVVFSLMAIIQAVGFTTGILPAQQVVECKGQHHHRRAQDDIKGVVHGIGVDGGGASQQPHAEKYYS